MPVLNRFSSLACEFKASKLVYLTCSIFTDGHKKVTSTKVPQDDWRKTKILIVES